MRKIHRVLAGVITLAALTATAAAQQPIRSWVIEVHGGAGDILRATTDAQTDAAYRATLTEAIRAGAAVLDRGGASVDAVETTIRILEDSTLFDAGRGAFFTANGRNEMDAAIMDGANLKAGAVACVTRTRHPISLARAVMDKSPHVMIVGQGADAFSVRAGLEQVPPSFFFSEARWQALVEQLKREGRPIPPRPAATLPQAPLPAVRRPNCPAAWATRPSSAPAPMPRTPPVPSPPPARASTSSVSARRARSAIWSSSAGCRCSRPPTR